MEEKVKGWDSRPTGIRTWTSLKSEGGKGRRFVVKRDKVKSGDFL